MMEVRFELINQDFLFDQTAISPMDDFFFFLSNIE